MLKGSRTRKGFTAAQNNVNVTETIASTNQDTSQLKTHNTSTASTQPLTFSQLQWVYKLIGTNPTNSLQKQLTYTLSTFWKQIHLGTCTKTGSWASGHWHTYTCC